MDYNEFADKIKAKYPQYKDMDNRELAQKMIQKYPNTYEVSFDTVEEPIKKGVDLTPSGLYKKAVSYPAAALRKIKTGEDFNTARQKALETYENFKPAGGLMDTAVDIGVYSKIPMLKGGGVGRNVANAVLQGGIPGALEGLKGDNALGGATLGTAIAGGIQSIPYVGRIASPYVSKVTEPIGKAVQKGVSALTSVPEKYLEIATKAEKAGKSILKDKWYPDTAYQGVEKAIRKAKNMLPTSESYTQQYQDLGQKAKKSFDKKTISQEAFNKQYDELGKKFINNLNEIEHTRASAVNKAVNNLKDNQQRIDINELKNDIDAMFAPHQGDELNRLELAYPNLKNKLYAEIEKGTQSTENFINSLKNVPTLKYNTDWENEAFDVLAKATSKDSKWLRSQLKALSYEGGVGKRKEFIENLLDKTDDKLTTQGINSNYGDFPHYAGYESDNDVARRAFDDIINKRFNETIIDPIELEITNVINKRNDILRSLNSKALDYDSAMAELSNSVKNLPKEAQEELLTQGVNKIDELYNLQNTMSATDLNILKNRIGKDMNVAWDDPNAKLINDSLKNLYNSYNSRLRQISPELAQANDAYSSLMDTINQAGNLNPSTLGRNLDNLYNPKSVKNYDVLNAIEALDNMTPDATQRVLPQVAYLRNIQNIQNDLLGNVGNGIYKDFSRFEKLPHYLQDAVENYAPQEVKSLKDIVARQKTQEETLKPIMSAAYERNPRLFLNRTDDAGQRAIEYLQENSGVNFMPELEKIRAREALENWLPGQGGGSGSQQGFANLLRTIIIGSSPTAAAFGHPGALLGLGLVSPKITGQAFVKGSNLMNNLKNNLQGLSKFQRMLTPTAIEMTVPMLYGEVKYYE